MKKLNSIVALLLLNTLLFGDVLDMVSPQLAASSSYYNTSRSTTVAITNPALTADIQRYTFDFSYLFLKGLTGSEEGFGQVINLGGAMPSKYGVLSSAANLYLTNGLSSSDLNVGTTGNININFSKEIYSDLYFGMGLSTLLGSDSTGFDWGLGLNLGFVRNSGSVHKYINDLRWGVALKNLGKGYRNSGDFFNPVVPIFTPSAFGSFSPYKNDFLKVNVVSEISVPTVSNLVLNLGAGLEIFDNINIDTSLSVNVKDFVNGDFNRVIPSIFIGYNMNIKTYEDIQFSLAATPYTDGIWAFGGGGTMPLGKKDTTPPTVNIDYSATQYISPNFDGIKDELLFPVDVTDDRYIAGYEFTITDTFGRIIKKIVNKEERPENESFSNLFHKLISPKTGTPVPENFRWDGKRDNGDLTPDGEYRFYTKFTDDNGNRTITKTEDFIIDTTNPTLEIEAPTGLGLIFSPNGDGNKDFLKIPQTGSKEQLWYGEISDFMGNTVRIKSWEKQALSDFEWDGKDDLGQLVPDGVYEYRVYSTDRAGNSSEESVDNIIINTKQPPIGITIDTNSFSPNGDGVKDYMEFVLDIPVKTGIIEWELSIKNKAGTEVNKFSTKTQGYSIIEDNIRFNGDNLQGNILAEGSYFGELTVLYQNGHNPTVESPLFEIDKTAPSASVTALYPMFSPNGDNSKDSISFKQFSSNEDDWKGDIYDEFGTLVFETEWKGNIESKFLWNGKNSDGKLLDNGIFTYVLSSTDKSGNSYKGKPTAFELNNSKTAIELTLSKNALSTKKIGDSVQLIPTIVSDIKLSSFKVEIVTEEGKVVKDISNSGTVDSNFKWNGLGFSGAKVPDSKYFGRIIGEFENGNKITSLTSELLVDSLDPTATVKLKEKFSIFSPNGDGKKDSLTFIQSTSFEDKWIGRVKDSNGKSVFEATWSGKAPNEFEFSGKDLDNKNLTDGRYTYLLTAIDSAGNIGKSKEIAIDIDTEDVALFVSTNFTHFSPNGDRVKDTLTFIPNIKKSDGIEGLTYEISDNAGNILYSKDIGSNFTQEVLWDGLGNSGLVPDGEYKLILGVDYKRGDSPRASTNFIVDTIAPMCDVALTDSVFSPNGDGNKDIVKIKNTSRDSAQWNLKIVNSNNTTVKEKETNGVVPALWEFDGRGEDLTLLANGEYFYILEGVDKAGNKFISNKKKIVMDNSSSTLLLSNNYEVFSPNRDKIKDSLTFTTKLDSNSSVKSWTLSIQDRNNKIIKEFNGSNTPKEIKWDGIIANNSVAPDSKYRAVMRIETENGNRPESTTPWFELDSKYPEITLSVVNPLFSPNGDTLKDNAILKQSGRGEELYTGTIYRRDNSVVKQWFWKNNLAHLEWDGRDSSGNIVSDGSYKYSIEATDKGGNKTIKSIDSIIVDTKDTDIFITYSKSSFAPDLVRSSGPQTFGLIVNNRDGIDSWSISIVDRLDKVIKVLKGGSIVPEKVDWDGKDNRGSFTNGEYRAIFNIVYTKGNSPEYSTKAFVCDSKAPQVKVTTSPTPFSPDSDLVDDELLIELGVKDDSLIKSWSFNILDPKGRKFISFDGEGKPGKKIIWDGKGSSGELVQAAEEYTYVMEVTDAVDHVGVVKGSIPVDILVIKEGNKLKIKVSSIIFEPNSAKLVLSGKNGESNKKILDRLSEILKKYSSYKIVVEGHANNIYGSEITKGQKSGLITFSNKRAVEVKNSLSKLGISSGRMSTVGVGGNVPLVDVNDRENTWKNRRVEFILVK